MQRRPRRYTALPPRAGKSVLSADFDECSRKHRSATCLLKPSLAIVCLLTQTLILRQVGVLVSYNGRDCDRTHHYQLMRVQQGGCLDSKGKCDMGLCTPYVAISCILEDGNG